MTRPALASAGRTPTRHAIDYNPFCPECVETPEVEVAPSDPDAPFEGAARTELPLELVATMEAAPPGRSIATLAGAEGTGAFAAGDRVLPGVRLVLVEEGAVLLQRGGALEYLEMGAEPVAKPKKAQSRRKPTTDRRRPWELEGAREAVECNGWNCTVERSFIESLTRNPAQLASQARVRPYARDGLRGFRFSRVRTGTLPQLLGLRSGDVVTEVNGRHLETMDAALAMASRLRTSSHLSIGLTRNRGGERLPLRLEIQIVS